MADFKLQNRPDENASSMTNNKDMKSGASVSGRALGDVNTNIAARPRPSMIPKLAVPIKRTVTIGNNKENHIRIPSSKPERSVSAIINGTEKLVLEVPKLNIAKNIRAQLSRRERQPEIERNQEIVDIDRKDHKNQFLVPAYVKDIYQYLRQLENVYHVEEDYLKGMNVTPKMRTILVDWLVDVQKEYTLLQETLHIAVGILDKYLQTKTNVDKAHMQLIGVASLFLACKYEEINIPQSSDLVYISDNAFTEEELYAMEQEIFITIGFDISRPISISFLRRYSKAAKASNIQHTFAKYFLDLSLIEYTLCHVKPSLIAAAAICLALFITDAKNPERLEEGIWTRTLEHYTEYSFDVVKPVVKRLTKVVHAAKNAETRAVFTKYSNSQLMKVSVNPELYSRRVRMVATSD